MNDAVDRLLAQWAQERPDVDCSPMGVVGRISRASALLDKSIGRTLAKHQLQPGEFDVLATLRRSGPPFRMTAGELLGGTMVTSGAVTHRLNRLASKGLIDREPDPSDRRSVIVSLTPQGRRIVDAALPDHVDNERSMLAVLNLEQQQQLAGLLQQLLVGLGDAHEDTDASQDPAATEEGELIARR